MGLFSTLLGTNAVDESEATPTNAASPSSLSLPTVIQMYTDTPFELEIKPGSSIPSYAHLTYQAVPVDPTLDPAAAAALTEQTPAVGLRAAKSATVVRVPTLGVWNCRVKKAVVGKTQLGDALLAKIPTQRHTVCWKVDLAEPSLVEPTLVALQDALVRYLIQSSDYSDENKQTTTNSTSEGASSTATTRLSQLRSVQFGVPAQEAAATENGSSTQTTPVATDERDDAVKVTLQIVAAWPQSATTKGDKSEAEAYRQKQTLALLYYHLRRYAASLNASLVFVRPTLPSLKVDELNETQESSEEVLQPTLNIPQLGAVWRALAQGKTVWEPHVWSEALELARKTPVAATTTTGDEEDTPTTPAAGADDATEQEADTTALVYGPGTHSEEWIESVLLRNAQYPGHWDTAKDPIWKILPPPAARETAAENHETAQGDQAWLQELRDSVALPTEAPAATPNKPTSAGDAKTPDVSDYFASLLTK